MSRSILTEYQVNIDYPVPEPLTIAHVSDLHERISDDILRRIKRVKPDFIVVTGDTFERYDNRPQYEFEHRPIKRLIINIIHYSNYLLTKLQSDKKKAKPENSFNFLSKAVKIAPVYLSLGNHEQLLLEDDYRFLLENGITLLDNASKRICVKGCEILIGGISTWDYEDFIEDYKQQEGFKLLLCHNPQFYVDYLTDSDISLTLSGHTHGGQFRVGKKGRGFFVPGQGIFGKYAHGSFFDNKLIVSAGCANTVAFPRLGNPRELVVIRLKGNEYGNI